MPSRTYESQLSTLEPYWSIPEEASGHDMDSIIVACKHSGCTRSYEVILYEGAFTLGTMNALMAHSEAHDAKPAMRRLT